MSRTRCLPVAPFLTMLLCPLFILLHVSSLSAQAPELLWSREYGGSYHDAAYSAALTDDGDLILVGFADSRPLFQPSCLYLLRVDVDGDTLWTRRYGGEDADWGSAVKATSDGGFAAVGTTRSFGPNLPADNLWLLRFDAAGDTLWTSSFGGHYYDRGNDIALALDGGIVAAGELGTYNCGSALWLLKTDDAGALLWSRDYGGDYYDSAQSIQTLEDGFIVAGRTQSISTDHDDDNLWLLRCDAEGDTLWTKVYGGEGEDRAGCVRQTPDGGFIVAGHTSSFSMDDRDVWLLRTDAAGDTLWTRRYGGAEDDCAVDVLVSGQGFTVLAHSTSFGAPGMQDCWLLRTDAVGDTLWTGLYGGGVMFCQGRQLLRDPDGGYFVAGYRSPVAYTDVWLLRTEPDLVAVSEEDAGDWPFFCRAWPNPFSGGTEISFAGPRPSSVRLTIHDLRGRRIRTLIDGSRGTGPARAFWDGRDDGGFSVASGLYFMRLRQGERLTTGKLLLLR